MSIGTRCRTIQLLEPDPTPPLEVTAEDSNSLSVEETGKLALIEDVVEYTVLFDQAKISSEYDFLEGDISNDVDNAPLEIDFNYAERGMTSFKLMLDSAPNSGNYVFNWKVRVPSV